MNAKEYIMVIRNVKCERVNVNHATFAYGFPPPSAFIGFMDALNHVNKNQSKCVYTGEHFESFNSIGIVVKEYTPVNFEGKRSSVGFRKLVDSNSNETGSKIPGNRFENSPEHHANMTIDIVLKLSFTKSLLSEDKEEFCGHIKDMICSGNMRFCSGRILPNSVWNDRDIKLHEYDPSDVDKSEELFNKIQKSVCRRGAYFLKKEKNLQEKFFKEYKAENAATEGQAFIEMLRVTKEQASSEDDDEKPTFHRSTDYLQGTVLISHADYYGVLSDDLHSLNNEVEGLRDTSKKHYLTVPLYTLGRWTSVYRMRNVDDLLWYVKVDKDNKVYEYMNNGQ